MKWLLVVWITFQATSLFANKVLFVNQSAPGNNNGSDWGNAFVDLQDALGLALAGDEIWVAQGIYYPTVNTDRGVSFNLPTGVGLYGGFSGIEMTKDQRNPAVFVTTLSGDIGAPSMRNDNSFHVVTIFRGDKQTIIDGFLIAYGYGDEAFSGFPNEFGGGILITSDGNWPLANPVVAHCRFEYNRAGSGGAIACINQDETTICSPRISYCDFTFNRGEYYGGAVYKRGPNDPTQAFVINDCNFESNFSKVLGGGLTVFEPTDTVRILKCNFVKDTANEAGAMLLWSGSNVVRYEITQCNVSSNYTTSATPGIKHIFPGFSPSDKIELLVSKCNFSYNRSYIGTGGGLSSSILSDLDKHIIQVESCGFSHNESQNGGAGILVDVGYNVHSEIKVDRSWFFNNITKASSAAGAFYYRAYGTMLSTNRNVITNSVFMFNDGAIASLGGNPGITNTTVANCSFYENGKIPFVKYWGTDNNPVDLVMKMQILNSIIWEPQTEGIYRLFYNNNPVNYTVKDYLVEHSLIHLQDCSYGGFDPCGEGMIYDTWPDFIIPPDFTNQMDLNRCSPAQNRGSNIVADSLGLSLDYWGSARVVGDTIDMGAYEIPVSCFHTGISDPKIPMMLDARVLQNPVPADGSIEIELFSVFAEKFHLALYDGTGRLLWKNAVELLGASPAILGIHYALHSGEMYIVKISDEIGRHKSIRIVAL